MSKEKLVFCVLALSQIIFVFGIFMKVGHFTQMFSSIPVKFSQVEVSETNASYSTGNPIYCPKPSISKTDLPITALASFPGCGNTWVRHLIQSMTGILTGSLYNDTRLRLNGFPGEGIADGRVIVIKTHAYHWIPRYQKTALIIRNPYNALLAEFNRRNSVSRSHTKAAILDKYIKNWNSHVDRVLLQYRGFYLNWIKTKNLHLVVFDNCQACCSISVRGRVWLEMCSVLCAIQLEAINGHRQILFSSFILQNK